MSVLLIKWQFHQSCYCWAGIIVRWPCKNIIDCYEMLLIKSSYTLKNILSSTAATNIINNFQLKHWYFSKRLKYQKQEHTDANISVWCKVYNFFVLLVTWKMSLKNVTIKMSVPHTLWRIWNNVNVKMKQIHCLHTCDLLHKDASCVNIKRNKISIYATATGN